MKKVVLIPDSFKGTLSSGEICTIMQERIIAHFPACEVVSIPVADGGEGSVDAFLTAMGGQKTLRTVEGPFFEPMEAFYGLVDGGNTAVVEMACCAGLPLVETRRDPERATTYGVGKLMLSAAQSGAKKIIVGLGGSCTNDGGCGAAAACGVGFYNAAGEAFVPTGGTLHDIARIDRSGFSSALDGVEIVAMCDIDNPMYGPTGAACIFGPQKGADAAMVKRLDKGLAHLCEVVRRDLSIDLSGLPGGGAAGAMGAGMAAFFDARLQVGIEVVLDAVNFDEVIADADLVFTGEGKLDMQSLRGKVVAGVARHAQRRQKPVIALVGGAEGDMEEAYRMGLLAVFTINRLPQDFSVSRHFSRENLTFAMDNLLRLILAVG